MGGVMVRDFHIMPELLAFLGLTETSSHPSKEPHAHLASFSQIDKRLIDELHRHDRGEISEDEYWIQYTVFTGRTLPPHEGSLFGKFFHPKMDEPTVQVVRELKTAGMRVVAGTNVIDSHYIIHQKLNQYAVFDKVYASHLIGLAKPDPEFFAYILKAEGIQPDEAFFTDDMIENVNAASGAGLNAFLYSGAAALRGQLLSLGLPLNP